jgi:hypothetical protein
MRKVDNLHETQYHLMMRKKKKEKEKTTPLVTPKNN